MQTGVVDGGENTPSNVYTQKMHEVQKRDADQPTDTSATRSFTNKKFWRACRRHTLRVLEAGDGRGHQVREPDRASGERRQSARQIKASGKDCGLHGRNRKSVPREEGAGQGAHRDGKRIGKDTIQAVYKADRFKPD